MKLRDQRTEALLNVLNVCFELTELGGALSFNFDPHC